MPLDIKLDEDFLTQWSTVGDFTLVRGEAQIAQAIIISIHERVGLSAVGLDPTSVEEQRGDIEAAARANEFTQEPVVATIEDVDYERGQIVYGVETDRVKLTITPTT